MLLIEYQQASILTTATLAIAVMSLQVGRNVPLVGLELLEAAKAKVTVPSQSLRSRPVSIFLVFRKWRFAFQMIELMLVFFLLSRQPRDHKAQVCIW